MIAGISHCAIKVRDLAAAERFYCDVLGLIVERRWPRPDGAGERSLWVRTGDAAGTFLALECATVPAATQAPPRDADTEHGGHHLLALRISPADRGPLEARLNAAGIAIVHRTDFTLYFADPEGNRLGLSHYPLPAPAVPPVPAAGSTTSDAGGAP